MTDNTQVDITGINKITLLASLWSNSSPAGFFKNMPEMAPPFNLQAAQRDVERGFIDYFCGRLIKMDLSGDTVDVFLYERDNGQGSVQQIVNNLKCNKIF